MRTTAPKYRINRPDSARGRCAASSHPPIGIDAPICQDIPLGGARDGLARAEVCHDTVVDDHADPGRHLAPGATHLPGAAPVTAEIA